MDQLHDKLLEISRLFRIEYDYLGYETIQMGNVNRTYKVNFRLADGSGEFAGVVFGMVGVMNAGHRMNPTDTNEGGWSEAELRTFLNETIFPELPVQWQQLIRRVQVHSSVGGTKETIVTSEDLLFPMSLAELGWSNAVPYSGEVDPEADEVAFACYPDNGSRYKKTYNGTGTQMLYWLRSPTANWTTGFCNGNNTNDQDYTKATNKHGICWLCCMGGASE